MSFKRLISYYLPTLSNGQAGSIAYYKCLPESKDMANDYKEMAYPYKESAFPYKECEFLYKESAFYYFSTSFPANLTAG